MTAVEDSGLGHGSSGNPQVSIEEGTYAAQIVDLKPPASNAPSYIPTDKHDPKHGYGSPNPIKSKEEGQHLLDTGYKDGKQIYNITSDGDIVKFQPDNSPENGYHAYKVSTPRDIPTSVLKQMLKDGKITKAEYTKFRKGKK